MPVTYLFQELDLLAASPEQLRKLRGDRMAMVYQDPGSSLNPSLTVGRQITEVYRFHRGFSKAEASEAAATMLETISDIRSGAHIAPLSP